jgi:DNA invertase Pin-like site-specific DNA recombinase
MRTRAALYYRVSTDDQSTALQRHEVEQLVRARGYEVVAVYEEHVSAAKARPEHEKMMKNAKKGVFDTVVVWALDRFGRSMTGNLADVLELDRIGTKVVSVRESWLDTGGPVRSLLVAIISWVAEQERARLFERTRAGIAVARRKGKKLGRPRARLDRDELVELHQRGLSVRQLADHFPVGSSTIQRRLRQLGGVVVQLRGVA